MVRNYTCSLCHGKGHNKRGCGKQPLNAPTPSPQRGMSSQPVTPVSTEYGETRSVDALFERYRAQAEASQRNTTNRTTATATPREPWRRNLVGTKKDIANWFDEGAEREATHLIVVRDGFDYDIYPIYVYRGEDPQQKIQDNSASMQRVMEVYRIDMDLRHQIEEPRAMNV